MKNSSKNSILKFPSPIFLGLVIISVAVGMFAYISLNPVTASPQIKQLKIKLPDKPKIATTPVRKSDSKDPNIGARYYGLLDVDSGTLLFGKNQDEKIAIASVTKVMTSVVSVENYNLSEVVEVSRDAALTTGSTMALRPNEKITVSALLHGLLLNSGNDAAHALAEFYKKDSIASPQERMRSFVNRMNTKAQELGLTNTRYLDPAGLDDDGRSSVRDQARLLAYAFRNKTISEIVHQSTFEVASADGRIVHKLDNSNRLVKEEMLYPGIIGGKTGFTPTAGHSLVTEASRDDHKLVAIIFNTYDTSKSASAIEARKLLDWGFNNFTWEKIY